MQPLLHSLNTRQGNFQSTSFSCPDLCNHNNPDHLECGQYFLQKYKQPQTWSIRMLMALKHCQPIFIDWWPTILDCNKLCKKEECHLVVRQSSQDQEFCFSRHSFKIGHPNTPPLLHWNDCHHVCWVDPCRNSHQGEPCKIFYSSSIVFKTP